MASSIYLTSPAGTIHLAATTPTRTPYTGSGSPWTSASTTPFRLAMNDRDGRWTPQTPEQQAIYGGGPPFRFGQTLFYTAEGNVVEQPTIYAYANNHNNATALGRLLREVLNTALQYVPCALQFQPDGASNTLYFAISHADVSDDPLFINDEAGQGIYRIHVTWTRAPHGYAGVSNTLVNNQTMENDGTGSPDNKIALSTPTGEMLWSAGAPLNMTLKNANTSLHNLWMATTIATNYNSIATAKTTSSSVAYVTGGTSVTLPVGTRKYRGMKLRVLARFHTFTNMSKIQFRANILDTTFTFFLLQSKKIQPLGSTASFIDFGAVPLDMFYRTGAFSTPTVKVEILIYSTDGTSVTATLDYFELLCYFDFCKIGPAINAITSANYLQIEQFTDVAGAGYRASDRPGAYCRRVTGDGPVGEFIVAGRLPRAREYDGGNMDLWLAWTDSNNDHDKADQLALTVDAIPVFYSMRGSG